MSSHNYNNQPPMYFSDGSCVGWADHISLFYSKNEYIKAIGFTFGWRVWIPFLSHTHDIDLKELQTWDRCPKDASPVITNEQRIDICNKIKIFLDDFGKCK